jgi:hypothetical protein
MSTTCVKLWHKCRSMNSQVQNVYRVLYLKNDQSKHCQVYTWFQFDDFCYEICSWKFYDTTPRIWLRLSFFLFVLYIVCYTHRISADLKVETDIITSISASPKLVMMYAKTFKINIIVFITVCNLIVLYAQIYVLRAIVVVIVW